MKQDSEDKYDESKARDTVHSELQVAEFPYPERQETRQSAVISLAGGIPCCSDEVDPTRESWRGGLVLCGCMILSSEQVFLLCIMNVH